MMPSALWSRCAATCWFGTWLAVAAPAPSALAAEDIVTMGRKTTVFQRSESWETVTFFRQSAPGSNFEVISPTSAPPLDVPPDVGRTLILPRLEKFGVQLVTLAPGVSPARIEPLVSNYNDQHVVSATSPGYVAIAGNSTRGNPIYQSGGNQLLVVNEVIVRFKTANPGQISAFFGQFGAIVVRAPSGAGQGSYLVSFPRLSGHDALALSNRLNSIEPVQYSHPNFIVVDPGRLPGYGPSGTPAVCERCAGSVAPAAGQEPLFSGEWHLKNAGGMGKAFADINALKAWSISKGSSTVVIAVLDDRIDLGQEDLAAQIVDPWDATTGEIMNSGTPLSEFDGHGTAAAGLAAAATNGIGIAGVAAKCKIMPIRTHYDGATDILSIAEGIKHAAVSAQVLSMSWTLADGSSSIDEIEDALSFAADDKGRVLVFAAGNNQGFPVSYPASAVSRFPIIAVSATDQWDNLKAISDPKDPCKWGTQFGSYTISAPGVDLYTTDATDVSGFCKAGPVMNYTTFSGTSAATPVVAGVAALLLSADPQLTASTVQLRLQQSVVGTSRRIDACLALQGGADCKRESTPAAPMNLNVDEN
jgi:subtilisin family serine protease